MKQHEERTISILVVDDQPDNLGIIVRYLKDAGYHCVIASNGNAALKRAKRIQPGVILLDVKMPGMDGFEVCRQLKQRDTTREIPVIFLTALDDIDSKQKGFDLGGVDYITKPVRREEVLARIKTHLRLRELTEELEQVVQERTRELTAANRQLTQEIAERKLAENALKESESRLQDIINNTSAVIYLKDRQGRYLLINQQHERIFHIPAEKIVQMTDDDFLPQDVAATVRANDRHILDMGVPVQLEEVVPHDDGPHTYISIKFPLSDANGIPYGVCGISTDITERKRMENELKRHRTHLEVLVNERTAELDKAKQAAELANRAKSMFLASMSHELRTPLNAILGFAQILERQRNLTVAQHDQVHTIYTSGKHLLTLISDILDISRIEAHKEDVRSDEFNLPTLIQEILSITKVNATEKDLAFRYDNETTLPAIVRGDARKLRQVLLNLLSNAIKYTHAGRVTFRVQRSELGDVEDRTHHASRVTRHSSLVTLHFQVADTGIGIPQEKLAAIFEPFTQVDRGSGTVEGTGLGLAISRHLLELMGGRLSVESQVGTGSAFTVELAMEVVAEVVETPVTAPEREVIGYAGERKRILLVDDNPANLALLFALLDPLGFEVEAVDDGDKALSSVAQHKPDLILMDLLMPGIDGHEALRRIRNTDGNSRTKIVGVSAAVADKTRVKAFAAECDGFVAKPVELKELLPVLKTQLRLDWIWEDIDATMLSASNETASDDADQPEKCPSRATVEELLEQAERGDFTKIVHILDTLMAEDEAYRMFCDRIRADAKRFDDEAIITSLTR